MPRVEELLTVEVKLSVAIQTQRPACLARVFAALVGQFYERGPFDSLARRVYDLYGEGDPEDAWQFRRRLDERLAARNCDPVSWDAAPRPRSPRPGSPRPGSCPVTSPSGGVPGGCVPGVWKERRGGCGR